MHERLVETPCQVEVFHQSDRPRISFEDELRTGSDTEGIQRFERYRWDVTQVSICCVINVIVKCLQISHSAIVVRTQNKQKMFEGWPFIKGTSSNPQQVKDNFPSRLPTKTISVFLNITHR